MKSLQTSTDLKLSLFSTKIQYGGLAEKQGIQVQDVVLEINGMSTAQMTHNDALEAIKKAGNACLFSLLR
jgi:C-terminal processing protease CtpA/Prc